MSELAKRVLFALVAAPAFLGIVYIGGYYFWGLIVVISLLTTWEMVQLFNAAGHKTDFWPSVLLTLSWMSIPFHNFELMFMAMAVLVIIIKETLTPPHNRYVSIMTTSFASMYPAWGFYSFYEIRTWESDSTGFLLLILVLLMIWGNDSLAYFTGKNFGKHKMAPEISPAKTWEGFFGGFIGALIVLSGFVYFAQDKISLTLVQLLPLVLIVSIFGPIGDLSESKIKRYAGKKDSSNMLPGHGGFFDRFDSVILVSPAVILYLQLVQKIGF
ncbi:phosphatidate cytidylyltransferase [bacterium]|nr:MAG: phosphatidate cytidylyltransferase [bacterium]